MPSPALLVETRYTVAEQKGQEEQMESGAPPAGNSCSTKSKGSQMTPFFYQEPEEGEERKSRNDQIISR